MEVDDPRFYPQSTYVENLYLKTVHSSTIEKYFDVAAQFLGLTSEEIIPIDDLRFYSHTVLSRSEYVDIQYRSEEIPFDSVIPAQSFDPAADPILPRWRFHPLPSSDFEEVLLDQLQREVLRTASEVDPKSSGQLLTFANIEALTVPILSGQLVPYLQSLVDLQKVISELKEEPFAEPEVFSITKGSADVQIGGIAAAIKIIWEDIIPWRRKHAREMAELERAKERLRLKKEVRALATQITDKYAYRHLSETAQMHYVNQVEATLNTLIGSPLELKAGDDPSESSQ